MVDGTRGGIADVLGVIVILLALAILFYCGGK